MRFVFRALLGLVLLGCAAFAQAQQVNVAGTARGIPFASNCNATNGVAYQVGAGGVTVNFACNGITYSCAAQPLNEDPNQVMAMTVGSPGRMKLNCGAATTVTGLQGYVADYYAIDAQHPSALQWYIDNPPPSASVPELFCVSFSGSTMSAADYNPDTHVFSFTCTTGASSIARSCTMVSNFGYDANGQTLLVPACIDTADPLDSPFLFQNGYEGSAA